MNKEVDMYAPIKNFFEAHGYEVKAEVESCDVVAYRAKEPPVIIELKKNLSLDLIFQGIKRLTITDYVYIAVASENKPNKSSPWRRRKHQVKEMCKRLGLGLLKVNVNSGHVEVVTDPVPYKPKKINKRKIKLLKEFNKRLGDPNKGGSTKTKIVTAYRQDALRCALTLAASEQLSLLEIQKLTGVKNAARILQKNYYGWFRRVKRGIYTLSEDGFEGLKLFKYTVNLLSLPK